MLLDMVCSMYMHERMRLLAFGSRLLLLKDLGFQIWGSYVGKWAEDALEDEFPRRSDMRLHIALCACVLFDGVPLEL